MTPTQEFDAYWMGHDGQPAARSAAETLYGHARNAWLAAAERFAPTERERKFLEAAYTAQVGRDDGGCDIPTFNALVGAREIAYKALHAERNPKPWSPLEEALHSLRHPWSGDMDKNKAYIADLIEAAMREAGK